MNNPSRVVPIVSLAAGMALAGCARVKVDPIQVQTIHIVHDVNIRVDKQLDDYFALLDQQAAATQPATAPAHSATAPAAPATTQTAQTAGEVR
jgi:hypothetical protein